MCVRVREREVFNIISLSMIRTCVITHLQVLFTIWICPSGSIQNMCKVQFTCVQVIQSKYLITADYQCNLQMQCLFCLYLRVSSLQTNVGLFHWKIWIWGTVCFSQNHWQRRLEAGQTWCILKCVSGYLLHATQQPDRSYLCVSVWLKRVLAR